MVRSLMLCALLGLGACGADAPCGVAWSGAEPELGTMVLDDGTVLDNGTWASTRLNAGTLTIDVRAMGNEPALMDALEGEFPVCRTLDNQNDALIYQDNGPWISDSSHTGTLAITAFMDGAVRGVFESEVKGRMGDTRTLRGAFNLPAPTQ